MEPVGSLLTMVLSGVVMAGMIVLPVLLVIFVIQVVRNSATSQQKEMQRLLAEAVQLLRENNRLLRGQPAQSPSKEESKQ